jgi:DNA helicase-2/ATP-dependent DNA helicase PcrA
MLNIPSHFTIIDSPDSEDVIDLIRQELKFEKRSRAFPKKGRIQTIISKARNCNIGIDEVIEREYSGLQEFLEDIEMIAGAFRKYKRLNHLFDYDDLMEFLRDSLRDNLHFRRKVQDLYRYIMVDEFQDTNVVQKEIVDFMAERHRNLMVVGDDTQSIYAFRGANFENILKFPETWKDCQVVKLEQNYRSNQDLLNFTNSIARKAQLGYRKRLFSEITHPWKPVVARFYDHEEEAEFIVGKIMDLRERDVPMDEVAVLYRASYHGNFIQAELLRRNIPYVVVGGIKFVERRHIKDLIAYMRIILNPRDAVAWNRVLKLLPGVGQVTASQIIRDINKEGGELVFERFSGKKYSPELQRLQQSLADAAQPGVTVAGKVDLLIRYYTPILRNLEDDFELRLQDADVLRKLAGKYDELEKFLSDFALDPPSDRFQDSNQPLIDESEDNPVTLSTIHSAKGLEWYAVFVPHLLDGLFPTARALGSIEEVEEERRLFYVACSRAKEQLYLTLPSFHAAWDAYFTLPSRFIAEIEKENYIVNE